MQNKIDIARAMSTEIIKFTELEAEQKQGAKFIASFDEDFTLLNEKRFIFASSLIFIL